MIVKELIKHLKECNPRLAYDFRETINNKLKEQD